MINEAIVKTYIENAKAELKKELLEELGALITSKYTELENKMAEGVGVSKTEEGEEEETEEEETEEEEAGGFTW